jgi:cytochrome c-type biogenesis protein CcmF
MIAFIGLGALIITLGITVYAIVAAVLSVKMKSPRLLESSRLAAILTFPLLTLTALSLVALLATGRVL